MRATAEEPWMNLECDKHNFLRKIFFEIYPFGYSIYTFEYFQYKENLTYNRKYTPYIPKAKLQPNLLIINY